MERAMLHNKKPGDEQSRPSLQGSVLLLVRHELQFCQQGKKDAQHLSEHNLYSFIDRDVRSLSWFCPPLKEEITH